MLTQPFFKPMSSFDVNEAMILHWLKILTEQAWVNKTSSYMHEGSNIDT